MCEFCRGSLFILSLMFTAHKSFSRHAASIFVAADITVVDVLLIETQRLMFTCSSYCNHMGCSNPCKCCAKNMECTSFSVKMGKILLPDNN